MQTNLLKSGYFFFETVKIELVFDEFFIDLAKEDVILKPTKPLYPSHVDILAEL